MVICVYGAASDSIDEVYKKECYDLCYDLAKKGHSLIYGSGSSGLMGAAARGFKAGGGKVHGVIPKFFEESGYEAIFYEADEITYTKTMAERKQTMEDGCDAFIITAGGSGTFEEFFEALTLKQLGRHKKAITILNTNGYYNDLNKFIKSAIEKGFMNKECEKLYKVFDNKKDLIEYLEKYSSDDVKWDRLKRNQ